MPDKNHITKKQIKKLRDKIYEKINKKLKNKKKSKKLEESIYDFSKTYYQEHNLDKNILISIYRDKSANVIHYIKNIDSDILKKNLDNLANISVDKRYPKLYEKIKEKRRIKKEKKKNTAFTDAFQCGRCKQWRSTFIQLQTRSADEPMTTIFTCLTQGCGKEWRI